MIQLYPDPNVPGDLSKQPANNFVNNASNALTQNFFTGKWDQNMGDSDRVSVRFMWVQAPQNIPAVFPNAFADPRAGIHENRHWNTTVNWIHNFTPTMIQRVPLQLGRPPSTSTARRRASPGKNGEFGIGGVNPESFARFTVNGLTPLVPGNQGAYPDADSTIEVRESDRHSRLAPDQVRLQLALWAQQLTTRTTKPAGRSASATAPRASARPCCWAT
ncbi:MAG: hypothetical protein R2724_02300 [Bryobacterales bacterium]